MSKNSLEKRRLRRSNGIEKRLQVDKPKETIYNPVEHDRDIDFWLFGKVFTPEIRNRKLMNLRKGQHRV
jgi:hypothetical protein